MNPQPRATRHQKISEESAELLALGESGRCEFKRDATAAKPNMLAALANWVALDPDRDVAHLFVGVQEVEDPLTGLVVGEPYGFPKGVEHTVHQIQNFVRDTRPIPVGVVVIEEAVNTATPFLHIEIRPTMPPHYDDEGRRKTREGRSTRALTDEELLRIYLDREAGSFAERFRHTSQELGEAVGAVGSQVDNISNAIESRIAWPLKELSDNTEMAAMAASNAEHAATQVDYAVAGLQVVLRDVQEHAGFIRDATPPKQASFVDHMRRRVWWAFTEDTWFRDSSRADRIHRRLHTILASELPLDSDRNTWETELLEEVIAVRREANGGKQTLKWWEAVSRNLESFFKHPQYGPTELPDLRSELRADADRALEDPGSLTYQFLEESDLI